MPRFVKNRHFSRTLMGALAAATAGLIAGCGGGFDDEPPYNDTRPRKILAYEWEVLAKVEGISGSFSSGIYEGATNHVEHRALLPYGDADLMGIAYQTREDKESPLVEITNPKCAQRTIEPDANGRGVWVICRHVVKVQRGAIDAGVGPNFHTYVITRSPTEDYSSMSYISLYRYPGIIVQ